MIKNKNMIGNKFGKWVVLEETNERDTHGSIKYLCRCECGNERLVNGYSLRSGKSKYCLSCKTKKRYARSKKNKRIKIIYDNMKSRCYNPKSPSYKNYGGRGIKICDEWLNNFENFYNWAINSGYNDELTIDRINVDGNYEPNNCRWATKIEQANNTRTNRFIKYNNETKTLAEWSRVIGVSPSCLRYRLKNWDINEAFNK